MKTLKTPALPKTIQIEIGKYKRKHPDTTIEELARLYECTYDQARNSVKRYESGALGAFRPKARSGKKAGQIIKEKEPDVIFDEQYHYALGQLAANKNISAVERISALDKLASTQKTLQYVRLEKHIKRADASIIARIIRRFLPEASDEEIIKIYREEFEKQKAAR